MTDPLGQVVPPAIRRLQSLGPLPSDDLRSLMGAVSGARTVRARRELVAEGSPVTDGMILLSGWACSVHLLRDGRRQIASLVLPGDLFGMHRHADPVATCSIVALTEVTVCTAPKVRDEHPAIGLQEVYAISAALDQAYLLRNITRLGRMSAYERIADWVLELHERLGRAGLASNVALPMPLTQEVIADALGLTSVHVNRTIQQMRKDGMLELRANTLTLLARERLASLTGYRPPAVSRRTDTGRG